MLSPSVCDRILFCIIVAVSYWLSKFAWLYVCLVQLLKKYMDNVEKSKLLMHDSTVGRQYVTFDVLL